jgi:hypothetical protein
MLGNQIFGSPGFGVYCPRAMAMVLDCLADIDHVADRMGIPVGLECFNGCSSIRALQTRGRPQLCDRFAPMGNGEPLPLLDLPQEFRELGFGVARADFNFHRGTPPISIETSLQTPVIFSDLIGPPVRFV